jgi:AraC-like DNA-binding protein
MRRVTASRVIGLWTRAMLDEVAPSWRADDVEGLHDPASLRGTSVYIAHEDMVAMWSRFTDHHVDPLFGIHFAERHADHAVGMFAHAASHAPDFGTAARACVQLQRLIDTHGAIEMTSGADGTLTLRHAPPAGIDAWPPHLAESLAAGCVHLGRVFSGTHITPRHAAFQHPSDGRPIADWFGCDVSYAQPVNTLAFDGDTVRLPFRHADATHFAAIVAAAARTLDAVAPARTIADEARAVLRERRTQRMTLASLAGLLGLSERSLQRKLADDGVTFRQLLDEVRIEALTEQTPLAQKGRAVAGALGYADPSSLRRLRKRWKTKR